MTSSLRSRTEGLSRGEKVIAFIERYCKVPEGNLLGRPVKLLEFQRRFILDIYDNPAGTSRAYLSMARKNGKTATIAMIMLAHIVGPEAYQNSRIVSGARTRKQAAEVYNYAAKMVMISDELRKIVKPIPSQKILTGLSMNVEYQAISADAKGAHGGSPILAILDEVGQVKGPTDPFIEAIETAQGAYEGRALLIAISTQGATNGDLFSRWLDDAESSKDPKIVSHVYTAPDECDLNDRAAWAAANPALGVFRSVADVEEFAQRATRMSADEATFRWLYLNQRVEGTSPFVSRSLWQSCGAEPVVFDKDTAIYAGLDLSAVNDLTAFVPIGKIDGIWHVRPFFWLPGDGLVEKARKDRVPYDDWRKSGHLLAAPGKSVDYEFVATFLRGFCDTHNVKKIAFDRWNFKHLRPWLIEAGFSEEEIEAVFEEFGQGFQSMSPALRELEGDLLNGRVAHGNHPVLSMCASNAVVVTDPSGNRKLAKDKSSGRIDGMVALAMARGVAPLEEEDVKSFWEAA
jgi:phage terminase large subunit-like protein